MRAHDAHLDTARRLLLVGVTGSGKTTLARRLAEARGAAYVDGDAIGWLPGWVQRDEAEQRGLAEARTAGDAWVLDAAWGTWSDVVLPRVDLVVALDLPRHVSLGRLLRRSARRVVRRETICNGNTESLRRLFSRDSIVAWHVESFEAKRRLVGAWERDPDAPPVLRLRSVREVEAAAVRLGAGVGEEVAR